MGILNVTPDSFSDGALYTDPPAAVAHAMRMVAEGAGIVDVGGESTRPGSLPVPEDEQIRRVCPVIAAIRAQDARTPISVDTRSARVAHEALDAGADLVNDVSALRDDPDMVRVVARRACGVVLMHMRGTPTDMQRGGGPVYEDVVEEVLAFLQDRARWAESNGVAAQHLIIDPGLGFGKRFEDNLTLLRHLDRFVATGHPVLVGASRKAFIGAVLNQPVPRERLEGSLACAAIAALAGAAIIRVHDVDPTVRMLHMIHAIRNAR